MSDKMINIMPLKALVSESLPAGSPLREVILEEPDWIPAHEYVIKVGVWLKLTRRIRIDRLSKYC